MNRFDTASLQGKVTNLIYDIERLALQCVACDGVGTVWVDRQALVCKACHDLHKIVIKHKNHEAMGLDTPKGAKVVYHNPLNGHSGDIIDARKTLELGREYTVRSMDVGDYSSTVELLENPGKRYNTVLFVNVNDVTEHIPGYLRRSR